MEIHQPLYARSCLKGCFSKPSPSPCLLQKSLHTMTKICKKSTFPPFRLALALRHSTPFFPHLLSHVHLHGLKIVQHLVLLLLRSLSTKFGSSNNHGSLYDTNPNNVLLKGNHEIPETSHTFAFVYHVLISPQNWVPFNDV